MYRILYECLTSLKSRVEESRQTTSKMPCTPEGGRRAILFISLLSILVSLLLGSLLFAFSIEDSSASAFGFAVTAFLNACTSLVVIWRYCGRKSIGPTLKESKAMVALGVLFIISALFAGIKTIYSVATNIKPDFKDQTAENVVLTSAASAFLLAVLAFSQLFLALKVDSRILLTDALNSFCGSFAALSIVSSYKIEEFYPQLWFLDDVIGLAISGFLLVYGTITLVKFVPVCIRGNEYESTDD